VNTDLGILARSAADDELRLSALTRGTTVDDVRAATGWDLQVAAELDVIDDPTPEELQLLRETVDPQRVHLR
jgi:glutaconate CoA-transferase subunit B